MSLSAWTTFDWDTINWHKICRRHNFYWTCFHKTKGLNKRIRRLLQKINSLWELFCLNTNTEVWSFSYAATCNIFHPHAAKQCCSFPATKSYVTHTCNVLYPHTAKKRSIFSCLNYFNYRNYCCSTSKMKKTHKSCFGLLLEKDNPSLDKNRKPL